MGLTDKQERFVVEYSVDSNGVQAAVRAGYSENGSGQTAFNLLKNPEIIAALEERYEDLAAAAAITPQFVLRRWREVARADPRELIRTEAVPCRYCHGVAHAYQWTEPEYAQAVKMARSHVCNARDCKPQCSKSTIPDGTGGFGFTVHREPHPECPHCEGCGELRVRIGDMRRVSKATAKLIQSVKTTKDGIEIKMYDQTDAVKSLAQYLRMNPTISETSGPNGGPIPVAVTSAKELTDDQLAGIILAGTDTPAV